MEIVPVLMVMVSVPVYCAAVTKGSSSFTNAVICWPAVTGSGGGLPPEIAFPLRSRRDMVSIPGEFAINAIPVVVLGVAPTETGTDTDREVTVVVLAPAAGNAGC